MGIFLSPYEAHEQGAAASTEARMKARVEAESATQKQIQMRQKMLQALASQNAASLGAVGTGANSGFGANVKRQLTEEQNDIMISRANAATQVSLLDMQASNALKTGNIEGVGDLISSTSKIAFPG